MDLTTEMQKYRSILTDSETLPHCDDPEIMKSLSEWVHGFCKNESEKRRVSENIQRAEDSLRWLENKINALEKLLVKKPSKIKEIKQLQHQMRELELKLAFDPTYGAEIKNPENLL